MGEQHIGSAGEGEIVGKLRASTASPWNSTPFGSPGEYPGGPTVLGASKVALGVIPAWFGEPSSQFQKPTIQPPSRRECAASA